ncbi:hypothetical protein FCK90_04370 [Kocuria coralli]|uniref:Uncharacterized protein n=1 Tax=Kocuria coralli TaxID=1461025 RepID=A0A5J5KZF0_9MICC|nr:hypothetical protein [Kocuria coralli]KAA9394778.1 hypothetical protein FCK90_04370 [Kocuria coralli]
METTITTTTYISPYTGREEIGGYQVTTDTGIKFGSGDRQQAEDWATGIKAGFPAPQAMREGARIRAEKAGGQLATDSQVAFIIDLLDGRTPEEATDLEGSITLPAPHQMTKTDAAWLIGLLTR